MTYLGEIDYFLGIKIKNDRDAGRATMQQTKFLNSVLTNFGMHNSKLVKTPQNPCLNLTKNMCDQICKHGDTMCNVLHRSAIGGIMYFLVITRPSLASAVGSLSQFSSDPCPSHWKALKCVMMYLQATSTHGLEFHVKKEAVYSGTQIQNGPATLSQDEAQVALRLW